MKRTIYQADWLDQVSAGIDFRHSHRTAFTDAVLTRADHLAGHDKSLVLAMYRDGHSAAQIARLGNLNPRQVRRRIKLALTRMTDPLFIFVVTHKANWSPTRRKVARSLFQAGNSIRQTADDLNLKAHQVRRHRTAILEHFDLHQNNPQAPNRTWRTTKRAPKH